MLMTGARLGFKWILLVCFGPKWTSVVCLACIRQAAIICLAYMRPTTLVRVNSAGLLFLNYIFVPNDCGMHKVSSIYLYYLPYKINMAADALTH